MTYRINRTETLLGDNSMVTKIFGNVVEIGIFGPLGGIKGFIVLDRLEFKSYLLRLMQDKAFEQEEHKGA